jgi:hypothetical protein
MRQDNAFNFDLLSGVLAYFQPAGRYKKVVGMTDDPRLEFFDPIEVRNTVASLHQLRVLERQPGTAKKGITYRINPDNLQLWDKLLKELRGDKKSLPMLTLKDLALLAVAAQFQEEHHRPARTSELLYKSNGDNLGLLNEYLYDTGLIDEIVFEFTSTLYIHRSAAVLSEHGLLIERGSREKGSRQPWRVTAKGLRLFRRLKNTHWEDWLEIVSESHI